MVIVISGNFSVPRDEIKELIMANGGKNSSSVSSRTSFLLAGEKPGPEKIRKAESLGIRIVDEAAFREMLGQPAVNDSAGEDSHTQNTHFEPTLF